MKIYQSRSFANTAKKLSKQEKTVLDEEIKIILSDLTVGVEKKGELSGIYVHNIKIKSKLNLLSYRFTETELELIMLGPHENYYRDLKKYIKYG